MSVVDEIFALQQFDISSIAGNGLTDVPLTNYAGNIRNLTGTVSVADDSDQLLGTGTAFTTELEQGSELQIGAQTLVVATIVSDTEVTLATPSNATVTNAIVTVDNPPVAENFVRFNSISPLEFPSI